jgi:hypothetical protein
MPHVSLLLGDVNDWREFPLNKSRRENDLKEIIESFLDEDRNKNWVFCVIDFDFVAVCCANNETLA